MPVFRRIALWLFLAAGIVLRANDEAEALLDAMERVPDLTPSLTQAEVTGIYQPWLERAIPGRKKRGDMPEFLAQALVQNHKMLGGMLPTGVEKITFYSLYPVAGKDLHEKVAPRAEELGKLPSFHGYPVLGSVLISGKDEAGRWRDYLGSSVGVGGFVKDPNEFAPTIGIRFAAMDQEVDVVWCHDCGVVSVFDADKTRELRVLATFSGPVRLLVNKLFDKDKIVREKDRNER